MTKLTDIYWIAAILEGEGTFSIQGSPGIRLKMTDRDIIERFKYITKAPLEIRVFKSNNPKHLDQYIICIFGDSAIEWLLTIYSIMGIRRRSQILEVINYWKEMKGHTSESNSKTARGVHERSLIKKLMLGGISEEQAKLLLRSHLKVVN